MNIYTQFNTLYSKWVLETGLYSNPTMHVQNIHFKEIVKLGKPIGPYILKLCLEQPSILVLALEEIYECKPCLVTIQDSFAVMNFKQMTEHWKTYLIATGEYVA